MVQAVLKFALPLALTLTALTVSQVASGGSLWMDGQALRQVLGGQRVAGHYSNGGRFHEDYHADGTLSYIDGGRKNTGRWSVVADTFCTIYDTDAAGGCFRVSRVGANCFEFYFIARTRKQAKKPKDRSKPAWTARAWLRDKQSTCEDESFV